MNNKNKQLSQVKQKHQSKAGYSFNRYDHSWKLDKDTYVSIKSVTDIFNEVESYLDVMVFYAENYSSNHTTNINNQLLYLLRSTSSSQINVNMLINFRSSLNRDTEWYLGLLKGFFKKWYELGYPGISKDVIDLLDGWRIKGNIKGENVKKLDPVSGPFTDIELQAFNDGAISAFEKNDISITQVAIGLLHSHTGRRPIQISHLKIKDVLQGKNKEGEKAYLLNVNEHPKLTHIGIEY